MHIVYGEEYQKVAERADGRMLFISDGYFFDSNYDLTTINLSDETDAKWREDGLIRQLFYSDDGIKDFLNDNASDSDLERITSLVHPVIIQLWIEDKLG